MLQVAYFGGLEEQDSVNFRIRVDAESAGIKGGRGVPAVKRGSQRKRK